MAAEADWLTIPAAAAGLGVSERTVHRYASLALSGKPSRVEARRVTGRRHKIEVRLVGERRQTGGAEGPTGTAEWRRVVDLLEGRVAEQGERITVLERLLDQEQQLHGRTQQQLERLLPAPRKEAPERRRWWQVLRR